MKIKKIIDQNRRDFTAIYVCESCGAEHEDGGYDDAYFHKEVIPNMRCNECDKTAPRDYKPEATKYPEGYQI